MPDSANTDSHGCNYRGDCQAPTMNRRIEQQTAAKTKARNHDYPGHAMQQA